MKGHLAILLMVLAAACGGATGVRAGNTVPYVNIYVSLDSLGNAFISEIWKVNIDSDNTEWYLAKNGLAGGTVSDLRVFELFGGDREQEFITEPGWDVNRSREAKAGRCGIIDKGNSSYEICWGVGSNGLHLWQVTYIQSNLVQRFTDSCAFNHMFLSDGLSSPPDSVRLTIRRRGIPVTDSTASVWAFGYHGYIGYEEAGIIAAQTTSPMTGSESMIIMAAFDTALFDTRHFAPESIRDTTFSVMKNEAFKGSDYLEDELPWWEKILIGIVSVISIALAIVLIVALPSILQLGLAALAGIFLPLVWGAVSLYPLRMYIRRQKLFKGGSKWCRDIPKANKLDLVPQVMSHFSYNILSAPESWDNELTAAYIMRLIYAGAVKLHRAADKRGKVRNLLEVNPKWDATHFSYSDNDFQAMKELYNILKRASGDDLVLQDGELKNWKKRSGKAAIRSFYKLRKHSAYDVSSVEAAQILGLYNYLKAFSLSNERGIMEVALWDQYLVYATAFGIGNRVMKEMKKVAPDYFELSMASQFLDDSGMVAFDMTSLYDLTDRLIEHEPQTHFTGGGGSGGNSFGGYTSRSSGGGGHSSYHGGGGHTGGGGGGGR